MPPCPALPWHRWRRRRLIQRGGHQGYQACTAAVLCHAVLRCAVLLLWLLRCVVLRCDAALGSCLFRCPSLQAAGVPWKHSVCTPSSSSGSPPAPVPCANQPVFAVLPPAAKRRSRPPPGRHSMGPCWHTAGSGQQAQLNSRQPQPDSSHPRAASCQHSLLPASLLPAGQCPRAHHRITAVTHDAVPQSNTFTTCKLAGGGNGAWHAGRQRVRGEAC